MAKDHDELSEELRALIALAPSDVFITKLHPGAHKVECQVEGVKDGRPWGGTSTRWMCPWSHSVQDWADAIVQVRNSFRR